MFPSAKEEKATDEDLKERMQLLFTFSPLLPFWPGKPATPGNPASP